MGFSPLWQTVQRAPESGQDRTSDRDNPPYFTSTESAWAEHSAVTAPPGLDCDEAVDTSVRSTPGAVMTEQANSTSRETEPFLCGLCDEAFAESTQISRHMNTYKRKSKKWVRCGKCLKTFKSAASPVVHVKKWHLSVEQGYIFCTDKKTDQFQCHARKKKTGNVFQCRRCPLTFTNSDDFKKHRKAHYLPKLFLCEWCSKTFTNKSNFICHTRTHTGEKPYKCELCPAAFKESSKLKSHIAKHSGEKAFKCDKCPQSFPYRSGLFQHLKLHSGEKGYKCDLCPAAFFLPLGLRTHMKSVHSDSRPYICDTCRAAFKLSSHLKRHKLLHTGMKPYKCNQCSAAFSQKGNMRIHMKVHSQGKASSSQNPTQPNSNRGDQLGLQQIAVELG